MDENMSELKTQILEAAVQYANDGRDFKTSNIGIQLPGVPLDVLKSTLPTLVRPGFIRIVSPKVPGKYRLNLKNTVVAGLIRELNSEV